MSNHHITRAGAPRISSGESTADGTGSRNSRSSAPIQSNNVAITAGRALPPTRDIARAVRAARATSINNRPRVQAQANVASSPERTTSIEQQVRAREREVALLRRRKQEAEQREMEKERQRREDEERRRMQQEQLQKQQQQQQQAEQRLAEPSALPNKQDEEIREMERRVRKLRQLKEQRELERQREALLSQKREELLSKKREVERLREEVESLKSAQERGWDEQPPGQQAREEGAVPMSPLSGSSGYSSASHSGLRRKESSAAKRRLQRGEWSGGDGDAESPGRWSGRRPRRGSTTGRRWSLREARILLRKIADAILTNLDDETLQHPDTEPILIAITLLKEAILGLLIAFAVVSFVLFIDHRFLLGMPMARNYRRATFHLMADKATLNTFEQETGLKFLEMADYEVMVEEVAKSANRTKLAASILEQRSKDLENYQKDMEEYHEMLPKLMSVLHLDRFCDTCQWNSRTGMTCEQRLEQMKATYKTPKYEALYVTMKKSSCKKSATQTERDRKNRELEERLWKKWNPKRNDFCADCEYKSGTSCGAMADYWSGRYSLGAERAKVKVLIEGDKKCRLSYNKDDTKKLQKFCGKCQWNDRLTCQQRVDYLIYTYNDSLRKATLAALEVPSCSKR